MLIRQVADRLKQSLWFLPAVAVAAAAILSVALVYLDRLSPEIAASFPLIFGGGPEGARGMLEAIASTVIVAAATTFSITIVALTLASSQFSPRVLRTFLNDRANQAVLATFMGTFVYAILVLRTIRSAGDDDPGFVPNIAVTVAILLAVVSLGMLIYFIHHIATRIQVAEIVASVAADTLTAAKEVYPDSEPEDGEVDAPADADIAADRGTVPARRSGYLADIDIEAMVATARKADVVLRLEAAPGAWVQEHVALFSVWPSGGASDELGDDLDHHVTVAHQRSMSRDVGFGIQQLVDIGVKALSPGINDPTTAVTCMNHLGQTLVEVGRRRDAPRGHSDADGELRLIVRMDEWSGLVDLAFDQLRHFGGSIPVVTAHLVRTLARVREAVPAHRHAPLIAQARLVAAALDRIELPGDRARVEHELAALPLGRSA